MSAGVLAAEDDWMGKPATKGDLKLVKDDLKLVKGDLKLVKSDLERKIDRVAVDLEGKIKDVRVEVSDLGRDLSGEIGGLRVEIAKQRVSMAWMTVGVVMGLGGLIALFQFLG